jgi:hypothetical protein
MSDIKKIAFKYQDPDGRVFAVLEEIQKKITTFRRRL